MSSRPGLVLMAVAALGSGGCIDWLEVDDGEPEYQLPIGEPLVLPSEPALLDAPGPLVPRTPGLRVPLAGYWTRVRLDAHDLLFPFSWVSLTSASHGSSADCQVVGAAGVPSRVCNSAVLLRLKGSTAHGDDPTEIGAQGVTGFRAVIPITLPPGTDASVIRDGFELPEKALASATMALRTSAQDLWLITPTRLRFERVAPGIITGSLEGEARRGAKGQRVRRFAAAFIALRAPDEGSDFVPQDTFVPPDMGGPGAPGN